MSIEVWMWISPLIQKVGLREPLFTEVLISQPESLRFHGMAKRILQLISALEIILSSVLVGLANATECTPSYYMTFTIRVIAWANVAFRSKQICTKLRMRIFSLRTGAGLWGISQVMSAGINCLFLEFPSSSSLLFLLYFVLCSFTLAIWGYIMFIGDDENGLFDTTSKLAFFQFCRDTAVVGRNAKSFAEYQESDNAPIDVRTLWASRSASPISIQNCDFEEIILSDNPKLSLTDSEIDDDVNSTSHSRSSRKYQPPSPSSALILREKLKAPLAGDVTISVVDWDRVIVNGKSVTVYKLGIGEAFSAKGLELEGPSSRMVRIVMKRLEELVYLRERYSSINSFGGVLLKN